MKLARKELRYLSRSPSLDPCDQVNRCDSSTIIYFTGVNEYPTQFVKVLLVKLSEMLDSSIFVRLFHHQSFTPTSS